MKKRLFLAISLPEDFKDILSQIYLPLSIGKVIKRDNYHITVLFLGSLEKDQILEIAVAIKDSLANVPSFTLKPEKVDVFPRHRPRMLWLYYEPSEAFINLVDLMNDVLKPLRKMNKSNSSKKIIPHTTLAYLHSSQLDLQTVRLKRTQNIFVKELVLFESLPQKGGSIYIPMFNFSFKNVA